MSAGLPIGTSWWRLVAERAELTPGRRFLGDERGRELTFGQFRASAERVAAGLESLGVRAGQVVSWQLPTTLESAVLMAALARLGVSQNPIIPILRRSEVRLITHQVNSSWLLVPGVYRGFDHVEMAAEATDGLPCTIVDIAEYASGTDLSLPSGDPAGLAPASDPVDEVRWYYYSSGTTSTAKGAMHTDASAMAASNSQIVNLQTSADDVLPLAFPLAHIGGIMVTTAYLRLGGRIVLFDGFDPVRTPLAMAEHGATVLGSATPFFHAYLAAQRRHGEPPLFPHLRQLQAGGAPITPELNQTCLQVLGVPIYNAWGLTEFPAATSLGPADPPEKFNGTVGRPAPGVEIKAVLAGGTSAPPGVEGELWVNGPQRCKGYVDATLDREAFDAAGFFRTGDLGIVDEDGFVRITGRVKDIIIRNAENISAQEIEDVLSEHAAIADVAVIGVPDPRTGERACAVVVLADGFTTLTIPELAEHCSAKGLAKQKVPEQLEVVTDLPRNPLGKVLKQVLRAEFGAPGTV